MTRVQKAAKRKRHVKSYLAIGIFIVVAAFAWLFYKQPKLIEPIELNIAASPSKEYVLKLNGAITLSSAGALIANHDRLFEAEGISVQLRPGASDEEAISAVVADNHVIGLASPQGFLKARAEGLPIVAFAASYIFSSVEFYALANTRLLVPSDLEGRRIGIKPGPEISSILHAFITTNSIAQSKLQIIESKRTLSDLLEGKIDILVGHRDVEGQALEAAGVNYRSLSPDSFGVHSMGPVYFVNEKAVSSSSNLERFLIAIANGWNAAYSDYSRTSPIIERSVDDRSNQAQISRFMDAQRRFLRPSGARFGELDYRRFRTLQEQLLQKRFIERPVDLARAVNYDILREAYRTKSDIFSKIEP